MAYLWSFKRAPSANPLALAPSLPFLLDLNPAMTSLFMPNAQAILSWLENVALSDSPHAPIEGPDLADDCRDRLITLPADGQVSTSVPNFKISLAELTAFLSNQWLDDTMLNAGMKYVISLEHQAARDIEKSSSTGNNRQIRHTGTVAGRKTTTQEQNKTTVKAVTADRFLQLRDMAFINFRGVIHENFPSANVNQLNPLSPGHFIIALSPTAGRNEVVLGEVVTMYSRGTGKTAKHDWVASINNLGLSSYIYVRKFTPMAGNTLFTSLACPELSSPTILQIPRTHVLFSFASYPLQLGQPINVNGTHYSLINLCPASPLLFAALATRSNALYEALKALKKLIAGNGPGDGSLED